MKNALLFAVAFASSVTTFAKATTYTNNADCVVKVEERGNDNIYYIFANTTFSAVSVSKDLSKGSFSYCDESALKISAYEEKEGSGISMSCEGNRNGDRYTSGKVDIATVGGELSSIIIDGQVRKFFSWKNDSMIACLDLVRK